MAFRKELRRPEEILATNYESLGLSALREHLIVLVHAEKDATDSNLYLHAELSQYEEEFRSRRRLVARLFQLRGGKVSVLALRERLFESDVWPGIVGLIETIGDEEYLRSDDA